MIVLYFASVTGFHLGAWRLPGPDGDLRSAFEIYKRSVRTAERGKLHAFFVLERLWLDPTLGPNPVGSMNTALEPLTLVTALSQHSERIGLVATRNTTYDQPFHVARDFATLDHVSGGRAGWNIVSGVTTEAANFGGTEPVSHELRYARTEEFVDAARALWDSWEDDAFTFDEDSGLYWDPERVHVADFRGEHLAVRGPLNIIRPPQGHPVFTQAGQSPAGRALAARVGELIFAIPQTIEEAQRIRTELKEAAAGFGRDPEHVKFLPDLHLLIAPTQAEAVERLAQLDDFVDAIAILPELSQLVGTDLSRHPLDGPVPEDIPETEAGVGWQQHFTNLARRESLTIRQLAKRFAQFPTPVFAGTPESIADRMQEWMEAGAADGFVFRPSQLRALDDFVDLVVPELQRRGIFRTEYEGLTLRENLGLPRPENQFVAAKA